MNLLFHAHSGLRYLVLAIGILAVLALLYGLVSGRTNRAGRGLTAAFIGLLDLQIVLGLVLVFAGIYYPALMGHIVLMLLGAATAHGASILARGSADERRALSVRLAGVVVAMLCIVFGILAIGRSVFGTATPALTG